MDNDWDEIFDGIDWNFVDREVEKMRENDDLIAYFAQDKFDYKRGYIRELMQTHPEISDSDIIDLATEQMLESHECGVELNIDDALRFVSSQKVITVEEAVKILTDMGFNDSNFAEMVSSAVVTGEKGTKKNANAKTKADLLTRYAEIVGKNEDVILLGLPVFDNESNWTQAKLAFFSENLSIAEKAALTEMKKIADDARITVENGVAVAVFQIYNIWSDFK